MYNKNNIGPRVGPGGTHDDGYLLKPNQTEPISYKYQHVPARYLRGWLTFTTEHDGLLIACHLSAAAAAALNGSLFIIYLFTISDYLTMLSVAHIRVRQQDY
jgi:hypothetical protein